MKRPQIRAGKRMIAAPPRGPMTDRPSRLVQVRNAQGAMVTIDLAKLTPDEIAKLGRKK